MQFKKGDLILLKWQLTDGVRPALYLGPAHRHGWESDAFHAVLELEQHHLSTIVVTDYDEEYLKGQLVCVISEAPST